MAESSRDPSEPATSQFVEESEAKAPGLIAEFWDFLRYNKKWWLMPIIVVLLLVGLVVIFGGTAFAPFIYTLF